MPALLTRKSKRPNASAASANASATPSASVTSPARPSDPPPTSAAASAAPSGSRIATRAPSATKASTIARPMPLAPPVTTPARSFERAAHARTSAVAAVPSRSRAIIQRWISAVPWPMRHSRTCRKKLWIGESFA